MVIIDRCIHLPIKSSKTVPFRQGVTIRLFQTVRNVYMSVWYLKTRLQMNPSPYCPLFIDKNGFALSRSTFLYMFKHFLECVWCDSSMYSGHFCRSGAATTAASVHIEDHLIKVLGRWSSDAYCRYIKTPESVLKHA